MSNSFESFLSGSCTTREQAIAAQAMAAVVSCNSSYPSCPKGRIPIFFTKTIAATVTANLTLAPTDPVEVIGLYFTAVGADMSANSWQYNQQPIFESQNLSLTGDITNAPNLNDFTLAAVDAGVNLLPSTVGVIGGQGGPALQISITNGHATADQVIRGVVLGRRPGAGV